MRDKLESRSIKCIFVGYPKKKMGYYFYNPLENKIFVARNAEFFENSLTLQEASGSHGLLKVSGNDVGLELIQEDYTQRYENTSKRHAEVEPTKVEPHNAEEHDLGDLNEPPNFNAALSDPEFDKWLDAMNMEMQSIKDDQVWCLVDLPPNGRTVGSKWLFKNKTWMAIPKTELKVTCYADVGFQTDKDDTNSQSRYVFVLNGEAVYWKSAKQSTIVVSSMEAEYIATAEASRKAVWMRKFIG
uniref:Retroviral polymerase SH3-like domain-containing protein n=1 Tax=Tanacetum cinerariifolium TaxID=118510 RepID=A0A6L2ND63_TANCI|nr:hypothetical protein [Tanacetum cinerariifolium]